VRVAFVHDYLTQYGGAERVLLEMHKLYPHAPIFTSLYDAGRFNGAFAGLEVRTSYLQRIPGASRNFRALLPLYPSAFEALDLRGFDLIISSTTSFAKGVRAPATSLHVSYINTPTRFLWYPEEYANEITPLPLRPLLAVVSPWLRHWDRKAAQRPNRLIANSKNVQQRIREVYGRESDVVHCPAQQIEVNGPVAVGDFYLVMSRLLPYKRVQLAIEACNDLRARLIVAGSGPDERRLRRLAGPTIEFAGFVSEAEWRRLIASAKAVIVPGIEDFGLLPLEAASAGRPSVAFAAGGALETIVEGETGLFFREPTARSLAQALQALDAMPVDPLRLRAHARKFSPEAFRAQLAALIERYLHEM
jgi:glycosyltransferase involved in cell wall biosynthesis